MLNRDEPERPDRAFAGGGHRLDLVSIPSWGLNPKPSAGEVCGTVA